MKSVGFIGLGKMGIPMTHRLLGKYDLHVYNRTREAAKTLVSQGAILEESPKELAEKVSRLVVMVSDDEACDETILGEDGIIAAQNKPLVINMSTISPEKSIELRSKLKKEGLEYIEAPVLGSVGPATEGKLVVLAAGENVESAKDLFEIFGRVTYTYPEVGQAARVKLLINTNLGVQMAILAETLAAAEKLGIAREEFLKVVNDSAVKTIVSQVKMKNLLSEEFPTAFPYKHLLKDLSYSVKMTEGAGVQNDVAKATRDTYRGNEELRDLDFSAILLRYLNKK